MPRFARLPAGHLFTCFTRRPVLKPTLDRKSYSSLIRQSPVFIVGCLMCYPPPQFDWFCTLQMSLNPASPMNKKKNVFLVLLFLEHIERHWSYPFVFMVLFLALLCYKMDAYLECEGLYHTGCCFFLFPNLSVGDSISQIYLNTVSLNKIQQNHNPVSLSLPGVYTGMKRICVKLWFLR